MVRTGTFATNSLFVIKTEKFQLQSIVNLTTHLWHWKLQFISTAWIFEASYLHLMRSTWLLLRPKIYVIRWFSSFFQVILRYRILSDIWYSARLLMFLMIEVHGISLSSFDYLSISKHALCLHVPRSLLLYLSILSSPLNTIGVHHHLIENI